MDYLLGLLTGVALFDIYLRFWPKQKQPVKQQETDPEVKRRAKEMHTSFQNLMNYDVSQALERKKVT